MPTGSGRGERFADVSRLLEPRSIAVIGASDQPGSLGGTAVRYLLKFGYPGAIWPVNPRRETVAGLPCFPGPASLPQPADLALLAIGAEGIVAAVRECAEAGIANGIVWAGGFAETGGEGVERQRALVETCRKTGFNLCGPNCIGIVNTRLGMTASFASSLLEIDRLLPGNISMVSQSGGMATITQTLAQQAGFGFRYVVSTGNEAVLTTADFIHGLAQDPETRVIAAYLEGVEDGTKLVAALEEARAARKPVVLLKGGATAAAARAAVAHTGALAGEDRVWSAVLRDQAVIRVDSQEELLDVALLLSGSDPDRLPAGPGVAAVTFGGGGGVLAADQCARQGLTTPGLAPGSVERLRELVTPLASVANPIDLTPETYNQPRWLARLPEALAVIAADPSVHTVFLQLGAAGHRARELMDAIGGLRRQSAKPVCVAWTLAPRVVQERLPAEGIYPFPEIARAVRAIGQMTRYRAARDRPPRRDAAGAPAVDWAAVVPAPVAAGTVVSEPRCHRLLAAAGLPTAPGGLAGAVDEALAVARAVGYPVALKGVSPAVTHRAAAGLLALGVRSDAETRKAFERLTARAAALGAGLEGIYVQHMVAGDLELLVSAFRDPLFGVMVSCGAGGNLTEVIDDVVLERAPVGDAMAHHMLERLRIVGHARRLAPDADLAAAARFLARFSRLAATAPWRRFVLEVNPVRLSRSQAVAVDGLLVVEDP
jgi:acyl-CoA synthetase (NDP forming)